MKRFLLVMVLSTIGRCAFGVDTDGDGLLDLIDVPGFNPNASGDAYFHSSGIQDLDGAKLLTNATSLFLYSNQITSLGIGNFQGLSNLQSLYLSDNRITSLEAGAFQGLANLQSLGLSDNRITSLENGDFAGLSNLQRLFLYSNQITSVKNGVFQGLSNLHTLDLGLCEFEICFGNQITSIENGAFQGLSNLESLSLGGNKITSIENGYLQSLGNLKELLLSGNQITSIENEDFNGLNSLRFLGLAYNQITSVENGDFEALSNLQSLDLSGNQIPSVEHGDFQGLSNLKGLLLSGNQITSIENGAFRGLGNLETLGLYGNQITKLNFTGATFGALNLLGIDSVEITDLTLDQAMLSLFSFYSIVNQTQFISDVSLVGLRFSNANPADLSALLNISTLDNVRVDQALFDRYAAEFNAFDEIAGKSVTVVTASSGDFDADGIVDAADYDLWRAQFGLTVAEYSGADANGDSVVDAVDYVVWRNNFTASGNAASTIVPEPQAATLVLLALVRLACGRRFNRISNNSRPSSDTR